MCKYRIIKIIKNQSAMKKIIISALCILAVAGLQAQVFSPVEKLTPESEMDFKVKMPSSKSPQWIFPTLDMLDDFYQGAVNSQGYANSIWPDSTVVNVSSDGTTNFTWLHSMGIVIDPHSPYRTYHLEEAVDYILDSVGISVFYENVDGVFADTLVFEVVTGLPGEEPAFGGLVNNNTGAQYSAPKMMGSSTHFGWGAQLTDPNKHTFKHVLTPEDSTMSFNKIVTVGTGNINVPAGHIIGINVTYVPGYTYNFGDTLFDWTDNGAQMNAMRYLFQALDDDPSASFLDPFNDLEYFNCSYLMLTDGRYGLYGGVLDEHMYPYDQWGAIIGAFIDGPLSIDEQQVAQMNIFPNPATDQINITLENYQGASFELYNILGEMVTSVELTGESTQVNVNGLSNGTYIGRVIKGDRVSSQKIVINN